MRVAIYGGAGFIGRPLARSLLEAKHDVMIFDNLEVEPAEPIPKGAVFTKLNCRRKRPLKKSLWDHRPEVIFWLVAKQGYSNEWQNFGKNNVAAIYGLLEVIQRSEGWRPKKIILASSQAVYFPGEDVWTHDIRNPPSVYGFSKMQQEEAFLTLCNWLRLPSIALRYSIVLGQGQSMQSGESGILRNWFRAYKKRQSPIIYGHGEQVRDFVHVEDVTEANIKAMLYNGPDRIFNIHGFKASINEMASIFQEATNCLPPMASGSDVRPGGEFTLWSNGEETKKQLGWEPKLGLKTQVQDFLVSASRAAH